MKRWICWMVGLCLLLAGCPVPAGAEQGASAAKTAEAPARTAEEEETPGTEERATAVKVEEKGLELGKSSLKYPVLTGLPENLVRPVNERIQQDLHVMEYLEQMSLMIRSGSLRADWDGGCVGDVFSCAMSAEGQLRGPAEDFVWTSANVDLRTGEEILIGDLFTDEAEAGEEIARILENTEPELSSYLQNSSLLPVPGSFRLERTGLTLLYPRDQLSTLSDRAGAVKIGWQELRALLDPAEDGIPARMGVPEMILLTEERTKDLRSLGELGGFPDIPARIGDSVQALTDRWGMLTDPDGYEGGRIFYLDGACFRDVLVLTDDLQKSWESSTVQGIRVERGCAWGLCTGETKREEWRGVLGEPEDSAPMDGERAEAWRTAPGSCDYYQLGDLQLRLFADGQGILIWMELGL